MAIQKSRPLRQQVKDITEQLESLEEHADLGDAQDELRKRGVYYITGEIFEDSLLYIHQDILLKHVTNWQGEIQLIINSCGGSGAEGYALVDLLDYAPYKVRTLGIGVCESMGAILLSCGTKGYRVAAPNCTILVHRFSWGSYDKHAELIEHRKAEDLEFAKDVDFWLHHSKWKDVEELKENLLRPVDTWLSPKEALKHGVVDKILKTSK